MTILLTIIHILVCFFLILVVLTQQGKGQDLASAFGGAGSQAAFGARGTATLLTKVTAVVAATFMVTSLLLGYVQDDPEAQSVVPGGGVAIPAPAADTPAPADDPAGEGEVQEAPESGAESGEPEPGS
ncbi:MAG: preprotein translocase subunit SecG [Acidobacteria bacterium]|nr:preprotein translocase subunit SecG [Acidobacteriota bacterium]